MPVVINEFEVVEQAPRQLARSEETPAAGGQPARQADPLEVGPVLRAIEIHAARAWAH
jgi:hypothetical protein